MFSFFSMMNNYEDRAVERYEADGLIVDTCLVTDSDQSYETAISHPSYNSGAWVIVEMYDTEGEARNGHERWVRKMIADKLPNIIVDASSSVIANLCDLVSSEEDDRWREKPQGI